MVGGVIAGTGFLLASFSNSIELLYLTYGLLAGIGLGVGYVTAVVSIAFWFDKRRTFATGIGASGTGLGTFIFAPLTQYLLDMYGWRGATLVLAGLLLNMCVCGALMRDPDWLIEENLLESRSESMQTFSPQASNLCLDEIKKLIETGAPHEDILDTLVTNVNTEANQKVADTFEIIASKKFASEMALPTYLNEPTLNDRVASKRSLQRQHLISREQESGLSKPGAEYNCTLASTESLEPWEKISSSESGISNCVSFQTLDELYSTNNNKPIHGSRYSLNEALILKPLDKLKKDLDRSLRGASLDVVRENKIFHPKSLEDNILMQKSNLKDQPKRHRTAPPTCLKAKPSLKYPNYFRNMRIHRNSIHYRGAMLNTHRYRLRMSSCPNIYRNSMTTIVKEQDEMWYDDFLDLVKSIFNFSLFMEFKFGMMSLSTFVLFVWFIIPYFYITEFMLTFGYKEEHSANLISVIGIFNTIGMIGLGWVGDQPWANVSRYYGHCLVGKLKKLYL